MVPIEIQFEQDFGHRRSIAAVQATLNRKKKELKGFAHHVYVVHVDLEDESGYVIDKNAWIVSGHSPTPADKRVPEFLIPRPR